MAVPCTVVASGGVPVTESPHGSPFTPTTNAFPVTIVADGGFPVVFVDTDGTLMPGGSASGPSGSGILLEDGSSFLLAENNDYLILEQA